MDRVIRETETAVRCVAKLLEPARVDREAEQKIRLSTRGLWVLRDNPNIAAALNRLQIAHNALNQVIGSLRASQNSDGLTPRQAVQSGPPPPYRAGNLLHWRMQSRLSLRKDGAQTPKNEGLGIRDVPIVAVEESPPAPVTPPQQNGIPSSTVPSASQNRAQYSEPLFFPDSSSRGEAAAPSCYSAPQTQKPFHDTFFSAAQPWHHPPDTFFSQAGGCSTDPEVVSPPTVATSQHIPGGFCEVFDGLETVDPNVLAPLTEVQSHKTWLSYQASRSGRRRRPDRYSLP
jgi:hypothetical protein